MSGVFSAENSVVEVYLDAGDGTISGAALFTFNFRRVSSRSMSSTPGRIPHAGYPYDEIAAGQHQYWLSLAKVVQSIDDDLFFTSALYYIRVIEHDDSYANWDRYNCLKCRFSSWSMPESDRGVIVTQARFTCERIVPENVP